MSDLSKEKIEELARLCRLELSDEELPSIQHDLKRILDHVEKLQAIDVSDLAPYSHMEEQSLDVQRDDTIKETLSRETFLNNAPDQVSGMIRVPTVITSASKEN